MLLSELVEGIYGMDASDLNVEVKKIAYDSRKVTKDTVFVCIKGFQTDGHLYINNAIKNGACAIVLQDQQEDISIPVVTVPDTRAALSHMAAKFYGNPADQFKLIGVTGTNGKTTVTYLIKSILESVKYKVGLIGTNQILIGDYVYNSQSTRTTPESLELQELFSVMAKNQVDYVVMEVSSHSLSLGRVADCVFDCGAFTNLTQDHLDFHHTMDEYLKAKEILFTQSKQGVTNIDEEGGRTIYENAAIKPLRYSAKEKTDIYASDIQLHKAGVSFEINYREQKERLDVSIPGYFSVYNALCAASVCISLNIPIDKIKEGLKQAKGVKGRAEVAYTCDKFSVIIDYAHTPDGLINIIKTLKGFAKGRVVTVFGCGGDRDRTKRPIMGKVVSELADYCIVTSDNPRTEDPMAIIRDILEGIDKSRDNYCVIENRRDAILYAVENAKPNDIILLAGKGHETYQEIDGVKNHFDEREVLQEILETLESR